MTAGSTPDNVVFDLGGVLVDWDPRYLYRKLLPDDDAVERFLAEVTTSEWNAAQDAGRSWADGVAELTARFPEHAELIDAYHSRWIETIRGQIDESVDILAALRDDGVGLFALTNWSAETFPLAEERFEWLSWFDGVVVSGREGVVKPDPRIYEVLVQRHGLDPSATVYVDDVEANVEAARALGMIGLRFTTPGQLRADLRELGLLADGREAVA
jgi:2-haloacid dehalogenase